MKCQFDLANHGLELARFGLGGTLFGAIGVMVMVTIIYSIDTFRSDHSINGLHILGIVGAAGVVVGIFGAFCFGVGAKASVAAAGLRLDFDAGAPPRQSE